VRERFDQLVGRCGAAGARIVPVEMPDVTALMSAYNPLTRPEAAWVHRAALADDPDLFTPPVRDALLEGHQYSALDYLAARQVRSDARRWLTSRLSELDALLMPSVPVPAPARGAVEVETETGPVAHRAAFLPFSLPFSVTGVPAVTVPIGDVDGLPVGAQLVGLPGADARLLDLAGWVEARD
jgi:aspartyl-tRNA(Asn)/glutamyl-tRNA(Gln) amidotransferase subunit A